jgi:hypothetical protein
MFHRVKLCYTDPGIVLNGGIQMKKALIIILASLLLLTLFISCSGEYILKDLAKMADKTHWNEKDSKYLTLSVDLTIEDRIEVNGNVTIMIPENITLTAAKGITVREGNCLTISGPGTLNASGEEYMAGIGNDDNQYSNGGTIIINGGTVNATGGEGAAGIGGGQGDGFPGTITINGGTVKALGGIHGTGIGGGFWSNGGTVTINGGHVEAVGQDANGIGCVPFEGRKPGALTLGEGVALKVKDYEDYPWEDYVVDQRRRYMKTADPE